MVYLLERQPPAHREGMMPVTAFGAMLKRLRKEKGETQDTLAAKVGVTNVALGDWERGNRNPKRINVEAVAKALGVPADDLLIAAGFTPEQTAPELERVRDADEAYIIQSYRGIQSPMNKDLFKRMAEQMRESEKRNAIGGRTADELPDNATEDDS